MLRSADGAVVPPTTRLDKAAAGRFVNAHLKLKQRAASSSEAGAVLRDATTFQRCVTFLIDRAHRLGQGAERTTPQIIWLAEQLTAELQRGAPSADGNTLEQRLEAALRDSDLMRTLLSRSKSLPPSVEAPPAAAAVPAAPAAEDKEAKWWTPTAHVGKKPAREAAAERALRFLGVTRSASDGGKSAISSLQELLQRRSPTKGCRPEHMYQIETRACGEQRFQARVVLAEEFELPSTNAAAAAAATPLLAYQRWVLQQLLEDDGNSVVVMRTGVGKRRIAFEAMRSALSRHPTRAALFLCPTVPLVQQQHDAFASWSQRLGLDATLYAVARGKGGGVWDELVARRGRAARPVAIFATPASCTRALASAAIASRLALLVIDECEHCVGSEHPYCKIALAYGAMTPQHERPKLIGLTAFASGSAATLSALCGALTARCVYPERKVELRAEIAEHCPVPRLEGAAVSGAEARLALRLAEELRDAERAIQSTMLSGRSTLAVKEHGAAMHKCIASMASLFRCVGWGGYLAALLAHPSLDATSSAQFEEGPPRHFFAVLNQKAQATMEPLSVVGGSSEPRSSIFEAVRRELETMSASLSASATAVIFVQERRTAHVFAAALRALQRPELRVAVLLGRGDQTQAQQTEVLRTFRSSEPSYPNVLVTTTAGEDGIESLPRCALAVRTEPVMSILARVRASGRSRYPSARYVVCCVGAVEERCLAELRASEATSARTIASFCTSPAQTSPRYRAAHTNWSLRDAPPPALAAVAARPAAATGSGRSGGAAAGDRNGDWRDRSVSGAAETATGGSNSPRRGMRWDPALDYKSLLNIHLQQERRPDAASGGSLCAYEVAKMEGPPHDQRITMAVRLCGLGERYVGSPQRTKKQAGKSAAFEAYRIVATRVGEK
tara:strand:+ start:90 stop:2795 length:2706 start_codon:yes stop_codon:yes gene_type:complete